MDILELKHNSTPLMLKSSKKEALVQELAVSEWDQELPIPIKLAQIDLRVFKKLELERLKACQVEDFRTKVAPRFRMITIQLLLQTTEPDPIESSWREVNLLREGTLKVH